MKDKLVKILNIILLILIIAAGWKYCEKMLRPVSSDVSLASISAFHEMENYSQDVIVYGSSHSWRGVNTMLMHDRYGINAFNYSCMWQRFNTTRLFLNDSFITQKPQIAVIDVGNVGEILRDTDMVGEVYYTRSLAYTDAKKQYLKECFGNDYGKYVTYMLPFAMYHSAWTDINQKNFDESNLSPEKFINSRGFFGFDTCEKVNVTDGSEFWEDVLSDDSRQILDDMVKLCNENGTKIIFITIPYYSSEYIYSDAMKEYAAQNGCDYIDFFEISEEIGLDGDTDFSESDHLNNNGAEKVTDYLSQYIKDNYDI